MSLSIGNGFFTTYISSQRMDEIKKDASPPMMSLWERIKQFFFSTHQDAALKCLHKLYHPGEYSVSDCDIDDVFYQLKALASPGCRDKFIIIQDIYKSDVYMIDSQVILSGPPPVW